MRQAIPKTQAEFGRPVADGCGASAARLKGTRPATRLARADRWGHNLQQQPSRGGEPERGGLTQPRNKYRKLASGDRLTRSI